LISDALGIPASGVKLDLDDGSNLAIARLLGRIARFKALVSTLGERKSEQEKRR
jgi:hypothetical protein